MKLGFISPMPPARTGVADYSAGLLPELRRHVTVDVLDSPRAGYDNWIFQLGNNPLHLAAYRAALTQPGIAVLHDAVLHHLLLGTLDERAYLDEFAYNYGQWMRDLARDLWRSRSRSAADPRYFCYPLLKRVAERSRAVVVHNPAAARMVREAAPGAHVAEIPHYFVPPQLPGDRGRTRDRLALAPGEILVAVFGYLRDAKRIGSVLKAMPAVPRSRLMLVGDFVSSELECSLEPLLASQKVIRFGHVPEAEFWRLAEATDICVNLRYPGAGETSGIAIKLMGIGKPVLVTNGEETSALPELSVIRIDSGEPEVEMLAHYLRALAASDELRREIGCRAAAHIAERHTLAAAAQQYIELARATSG